MPKPMTIAEHQGRKRKPKGEDEFDLAAGGPETEAKEDETPKEPEADENGQLVLIDVEHEADKEIKSLAQKIKAQDKIRGEAQEKADELRGELLEVMHRHKVKRWVKGDLEAEIKPKEERVSVKLRERDSDE